jgi:hypothetical protein
VGDLVLLLNEESMLTYHVSDFFFIDVFHDIFKVCFCAEGIS